MTSAPICIGIERGPVGAKMLTVSCSHKASKECCGHAFCAECYRRHRRGVHPPKDKALQQRRRAAA